MITIKCPCGRTISTFQSRIGRKKYCSKKCFYRYRKRPSGLKYNIKVENKGWFQKGKVPPTAWKKGDTPWNKNLKGIHLSPETEFKKGENLEEKNNKWKGNDVGYGGIHTWIERKYGSANKCENRENNILDFKCSNKSDNYNWALIKGKRYERKRENFVMLCRSCHLRYDEINKKKR